MRLGRVRRFHAPIVLPCDEPMSVLRDAVVDVDAAGDLPTALRAALACDGPSVVAVECSSDEIPPFAAFLTSKESTHVAVHA